MRWFYQCTAVLLVPFLLYAAPVPNTFKAEPTRPTTEARVIVEDQEILETCDTEKICVEGRLANTGAKAAYQVKLRIEIGGTKRGKPRLTLIENVATTTMAPGDRQEFSITIDRKIPKKNSKGEEKIIEVGKYNFRIVPVWTQQKTKPAKPPAKPKRKNG